MSTDPSPNSSSRHVEGERHQGFEGLYLNMRAAHGDGRDLSELLRERALVEESCSKLHGKLSRMAATNTHTGPLVPLWASLRALGDKQGACHQQLARRLHEAARAVAAHAENHGRTQRQAKQEASRTLDALQGLDGAVLALQRGRSQLQTRSAHLERLRSEGAASHALQRAESKCKKSGEDYRRRLEHYRALRAAFEQRVASTAQKFHTLEKSHVTQMRSFLQTYAQTLWDTHVQMGHMHVEFQQWLDIHTAEELMRLSPRVGPSTERQGPVESQECNSATMMEGLKKRTKLTFGIKRKDKDSEST